LNGDRRGSGVGGDNDENGEVDGDVSGGGNHGIPSLINLTAFLSETVANSSTLFFCSEIKRLSYSSSLLNGLPLCVVPNINLLA